MSTARLLCLILLAGSVWVPNALAASGTWPGHPVFGALSVIALMSAVIGAFWGEVRLLVLAATAVCLLAALVSVDGRLGDGASPVTLVLIVMTFLLSFHFTRRMLGDTQRLPRVQAGARAVEVLLVVAGALCLVAPAPLALKLVGAAGFTAVVAALLATFVQFVATRWRPALILHAAWLTFTVLVIVRHAAAQDSLLSIHGYELAATAAVVLFGLALVDQQVMRGQNFAQLSDLRLAAGGDTMARRRLDRSRRNFSEDVARLVDELDPDLYEESIMRRFLDYLSGLVPVAAAAVAVSHRGDVRLVVSALDPVREEFESILATREELLQSICLSDRAAVIHSDDLGLVAESSTASCLGIVPVRASRNEWAGVLLARSGELEFGLDELELVSDFAHQAYDAIRSAQKFRRVKREAETDALTGVFNRGAVMARGLRAFRKHRSLGTPLAILFIDIDHFKLVNDRHGHSAGDAALRAVARLCSDCLRDVDFLGRYGGEEFLAVLPGASAREAGLAAERLRRAVAAANFVHETRRIALTVSVGIAELGDKFPDFDSLLRAADRALYRAKREGRNRVVHHRYMLRGDRVGRHL